MAARAWEDIKIEFLMRAWKKLLGSTDASHSDVLCESEVTDSMISIGSELLVSLSIDDIHT